MPSVQLTAVMFCDAVASTDLLVRIGDEGFDATRRRFEAIVRRSVARHQGRVVKELGDGALAAFDAPSDAIAAAVTIQQAIARGAPGGADVLAAHIGISAGEVTVEATESGMDDLFGTTVVEASRLCDAAGAGEVLVAAVAAALTRNPSAPLRAVAPLALKGFPDPVAAFEVRWTEVVDPGPPAAGPELPVPLRTAPAIPFVARPPEWEQLRRAWGAVQDGGRQAVFVRGQPGAGKTRLVAEFARHAASEGATVVFGACPEGGGPPFGPVVDALEHLLAHAEEVGIVAADAERAHRLLQLDPDEDPGLGLTFGQDPRAARFRAAADLLVDAGTRAPVLFVLDDLQWAGRPTLQLLAHCLRTTAPLRCCFVATHREARADTDDAFDDALAEFHRMEGMTSMLVSGFDRDGVTAFVEAASGGPIARVPSVLVDVLAEQTDGNPFLLGELWRHFVETGAVRRDPAGWTAHEDFDAFSTPESLRSVVARRIDRLPADARALLEVAAVAGPAFDVALVAATADTDVAAALDLLEPALASATVEVLTAGTFRFAHAIVRRAIYDRLPAARRARLHLEVAHAIERRGVDDRAWSDLARHYTAAVPIADPATAVDVAERAAEIAQGAAAFEDAADLLTNALPFAAGAERRAELLVRIAAAELPAGDAARAREHVLEALDIARVCGRDDLMVRAALGFEEASWRLGLPGADAERLLREVLPRAPNEATRIHAMAARGRAMALSGDSGAAEVIEAAIVAARLYGDRVILRFALGTWFNLLGNPETYGQFLDRAYEMRVLCSESESDDLGMAAHAQHWFVFGLLLNTQFAGLADAVAELHRVCERGQQPFNLHLSAAVGSTIALMEGRFDDAERSAERAGELAAGLSGVDVSGAYGVQMFSLRREQGRLEEIRRVVEAVARLDRSHAAWRPGLAAVYAELGLLEECRAEVRTLVTPGLERVPRDALYVAALTYLADAVTAIGDRFAATLLYAALEPYRNSFVVVGHMIACYGSVDRYLGALAETAGRARDAERHFVRAIELDSSAGAATWLADSRYRYARFLARQRRRDGPQRALGLLDEVVAATRRIGMPALLQRALELSAEISATGAETDAAASVASREHASAGDGFDATLTRREREILDCLVDGLSNAGIGSALHISANTAANHVRSILQKTGCANRTEAAGWAVRNGLVTR